MEETFLLFLICQSTLLAFFDVTKAQLISTLQAFAGAETHCAGTWGQFHYFSCFHTETSANFRNLCALTVLLCKFPCPHQETHHHLYSSTQMEFPLNTFQPLPLLRQGEKICISMKSRIALHM